MLDATPNDISVVAGIITQDFQTPLSHINVLARNRGTPNMGLRNAFNDPALRALDGKWVRLVVGAFEYTITEVTADEADAWWEAHKPPPRQVPAMDLTVTDLRDIEYVVLESAAVPMRSVDPDTAITAFGAKAAGYSVLRNTPGVPTRKAFAIPVFYYDQFMKQNGFYDRVRALRADPEFRDKPAVRDAALAQLRADILAAPVDAAFQALLKAKLDDRLPGPDDALPHQHERRGSRRLPVRRLLRLAHRRSGRTGASTSRPATPTATRTAACCRRSARPGRRSGSCARSRSASTTASITPRRHGAAGAPQLRRRKRPTASR